MTLRDSIILLKNAVYARVSGASGDSLFICLIAQNRKAELFKKLIEPRARAVVGKLAP